MLSLFLIYTSCLFAFHTDHAAQRNALSLHLSKRAAHRTLRSLMRQEDELNKSVFIPLPLLHHRGDADAMPGKSAGNEGQNTRLVLGEHPDKMYA